jgi:iron complex outermembrane recepter protein
MSLTWTRWRSGRRILRQPDVRLLLTPSYDVVTGNWTTRVYGALAYIGRRPADQDNTFFFDGYTTIDAGVLVTSPWKWDVQLYGENLSDRHDATEGDPRSTVAANFRPILGRSVVLGVSYKF